MSDIGNKDYPENYLKLREEIHQHLEKSNPREAFTLLRSLLSYPNKITNEIQLPNGEKVIGKFIEYSGDHTIKKETNGRLYIAA